LPLYFDHREYLALREREREKYKYNLERMGQSCCQLTSRVNLQKLLEVMQKKLLAKIITL